MCCLKGFMFMYLLTQEKFNPVITISLRVCIIEKVLSTHKVKINLTQAHYKCGSTHSLDAWKAQHLQKQAQNWQVTFTSNLLFQFPGGAMSFSQQSCFAAPEHFQLAFNTWVWLVSLTFTASSNLVCLSSHTCNPGRGPEGDGMWWLHLHRLENAAAGLKDIGNPI